MSEPRSNKVYSALNNVPMLARIKRDYFVGISIASMLIFTSTKQILVPIATFLILYAVVRYLTRDDPNYITIFLASRSLPRGYDPGKYSRKEVTKT